MSEPDYTSIVDARPLIPVLITGGPHKGKTGKVTSRAGKNHVLVALPERPEPVRVHKNHLAPRSSEVDASIRDMATRIRRGWV